MNTVGNDQAAARDSFRAIIGNGETCAFVDPGAVIDWLCTPRFDSPFALGRLIDKDGGFFSIKPIGSQGSRWTQAYRTDTAILESRCQDASGNDLFTVTDWMPWGHHELRRQVVGNRGGVRVEVLLLPAFDYRRARHTWSTGDDSSSGVSLAKFSASGGGQALHLFAPKAAIEKSTVGAGASGGPLRLVLNLDRPVQLCLGYLPGEQRPPPGWHTSLESESAFWGSWIARSRYRGRHLAEFKRSLITMKLLTYAASGAILAAASTSISLHPGTGTAYDYRFPWVRDGAYAASAFAEAGYFEEARAFLDFLFSVMCRDPGGKPWQPLYRLDGDPDCREEELWHLSGFCGDAPVRIGNDAFRQVQNDAEGEVLDALWDLHRLTGDDDLLAQNWEQLRRAALYSEGHWRETDSGLWELRGVTGQYSHSKVMCFVTLERAAQIADRLGQRREANHWRAIAAQLRQDILARGFNRRMGAFTLAYDTPILDSSTLAVVLSGLLPPGDPMVRSSLARIEADLAVDGLVARNLFEPTPFQLVTFWMARAYHRTGETGKARSVVDASLRGLTDLGLFWEHVLCAPDTAKPSWRTRVRGGAELLLAHDSLKSVGTLAQVLWNYFRARNPSTRKIPKPRLEAAQIRLFRGNFPQLFSHEGLVRTLLEEDRHPPDKAAE